MRNWVKSSPFWFGMAGLLVLLVGGTATWWWWDFLHGSIPGTTASTTLRNMGILVGGGLAAVFAIWRGWVAERQSVTAQRQTEIADQNLLNERYQRGSQMLGDANLAVRLAGIYALQRLAKEDPRQYDEPIIRLFCAFVRNHTEDREIYRERVKRRSPSDAMVPEDVKATLSAIRERCQKEQIQKRALAFRVDLSGASLAACDLSNMDLCSANLYGATLAGCDLSGTCLKGAKLDGTNLSFADLSHTVFSNTAITNADLSNVKGDRPDFSGVQFWLTNFSDATWTGATFRGAIFAGCEFKNTELKGADLSVVYFVTSTNELAAKSQKIGVTQAQLNEAYWDPDRPPKLNGLLDSDTLDPLVLEDRLPGELPEKDDQIAESP